MASRALCEPHPSRDHTERMLPGFGVPVLVGGDGVCAGSVYGVPLFLEPADVAVPADASRGAFLAGAVVAFVRRK